MRIVSKARLRDFWKRHPDSEQPLRAWFHEVSLARWQSFTEVRKRYPNADLVGDRIVFNIGGNKYRLIAVVDFRRHGVLIRFVGTHAAYDRIDAREI